MSLVKVDEQTRDWCCRIKFETGPESAESKMGRVIRIKVTKKMTKEVLRNLCRTILTNESPLLRALSIVMMEKAADNETNILGVRVIIFANPTKLSLTQKSNRSK